MNRMILSEAWEKAYRFRDYYLKCCRMDGVKPDFKRLKKSMDMIVRLNFQIKFERQKKIKWRDILKRILGNKIGVSDRKC